MDMRNNEVIVVDVKMRFWSMVMFMVKWAIASIPALIILAMLLAVITGLFQGFLGRWYPHGFRM